MARYESRLDMLRAALELADTGVRFAMAVVLRADGSTPQRVGARAIILENGDVLGTIGGGLVEAVVRDRTAEVCESGQSSIVEMTLNDTYSRDSGPICGGSMQVLLQPISEQARACFAEAVKATDRGESGVLVTRLPAPAQSVIDTYWLPTGAPSAEEFLPEAGLVQRCIARQKPELFYRSSTAPDSEDMFFIEPVAPAPMLLIVGGGHVGQALARQASIVGFDITVIDDRPEYTQPRLYPDSAVTRCGDVATEVAAFPMNADTYIVLVTRGHKSDAEALEACIHRPAAYLGMIGSARKVDMIRQDFLRAGRATEEEWGRVHAPVGLDIGAVTVSEIATSIAAQLIAVRRKGHR